MRAFRAVAAVVLSATLLTGCGSSGSGGGGDAPPKGSAEPATSTSASTDPGTGAGPAASPSPGGSTPGTGTGASPVPAPGETLVRVTRSGGFAGETHALVVKGDGSWSRLDGKARPEGTGKLSEQELAALRTALREADFARLPKVATGGPKIYDGFFYTFTHGGYEVAGEQGSLPPALERVARALPPFTER
ncbi:hypothetical protein ACFCYM_03495 [Streptomyces sp. NPDC056254]|uniref:hypothetical protein n=1 Tax=Streptomyces sp. NPDC056254 TaxID=3345763 RepID=UPI0035D61BB8